MVPPVKPVPAMMLVTVPLPPPPAPQVKPEVQAAQAVRTWPSVPTAKAVGVEAALAEMSVAFAVNIEQGIAAAPLS